MKNEVPNAGSAQQYRATQKKNTFKHCSWNYL